MWNIGLNTDGLSEEMSLMFCVIREFQWGWKLSYVRM